MQVYGNIYRTVELGKSGHDQRCHMNRACEGSPALDALLVLLKFLPRIISGRPFLLLTPFPLVDHVPLVPGLLPDCFMSL